MEQGFRKYLKGESEKSRGIPVLISASSFFSIAREEVQSNANFFTVGVVEKCHFCAPVIIP